MNDKVSELRKILNQKKTMEDQKNKVTPSVDEFDPEQTLVNDQSQIKVKTSSEKAQSDKKGKAKTIEIKSEEVFSDTTELESDYEELKGKLDDALKANQIQKDMYLAKAAEFENYKKRLKKEHDEFAKYANEKLLTELLPIIDSLEMTLSHTDQNDKDPIVQGVMLIQKQILQTLEKFGVTVTRGQGEPFDPNVQEAIGVENKEGIKSGVVITVHRPGFVLNGKVVRAAMVTVAQ